MQHAGSSPLTRDPTWPPRREHAVLATGPQGSPTENGTLWGRLPRPCSLTHIPQPAFHQVLLLPPPNPLASVPSSPRPVVPFVQTQHFSDELGKGPTLTSLAFSLSLSGYANVILPNTKLASSSASGGSRCPSACGRLTFMCCHGPNAASLRVCLSKLSASLMREKGIGYRAHPDIPEKNSRFFIPLFALYRSLCSGD